MDADTAESLVSAERRRAFAATLWFRVVAAAVIGVAAGYRHSLPDWMREGFVLAAWPLFAYNLLALLARRRLEPFLARHPGWLSIDLMVSLALLALGGGWRSSYLFYTITTLILFMIFLHSRGVWVATGLFMITALVKDPVGDLPALETFAVPGGDMRLGAALAYLCAALVLAYFDALLRRIERLGQEHVAETRRRVAVEEQRRLALQLHDGAKQMVLALLLRSRNLLRRPDWGPDQGRQELQWLWRGLSYLQFELNHLVRTLSQPDVPAAWALVAILRQETELAAALTGGTWSLEAACERPLLLSSRRRDALRHFLSEALMNTWKHSGQPAGALELSRNGDELLLQVTDSDRGFDPTGLDPKASLGLRSLAQRAQELGGRFEVDSQPGSGCRLRLWFPAHDPSQI